MEPTKKRVRVKPGTGLPVLATVFIAVAVIAASWRDLRMAGSLAVVLALTTGVWASDSIMTRRRLAIAFRHRDELLAACDELDAVIVRVDVDSPTRFLASAAGAPVNITYSPVTEKWYVYVGGVCFGEDELPYVALYKAVKTYDKEDARGPKVL